MKEKVYNKTNLIEIVLLTLIRLIVKTPTSSASINKSKIMIHIGITIYLYKLLVINIFHYIDKKQL